MLGRDDMAEQVMAEENVPVDLQELGPCLAPELGGAVQRDQDRVPLQGLAPELVAHGAGLELGNSEVAHLDDLDNGG